MAIGLYPAGFAKSMVDVVLVEVVGRLCVSAAQKRKGRVGDKGKEESFASTVRTVTAHPLGKFAFHCIGHCAAVATARVCFHSRNSSRYNNDSGSRVFLSLSIPVLKYHYYFSYVSRMSEKIITPRAVNSDPAESTERPSSEERLKSALVEVRSALVARLEAADITAAMKMLDKAVDALRAMTKEYEAQNEHGKMYYHIEAASQLRRILEGALQVEAEKKNFPHAAAVLAQ
jgi:hypothetical protein